MSTIKNFKLNKIYRRKKISIVKSNYILFQYNDKLHTRIKNKSIYANYTYVTTDLQLENTGNGGTLLRVEPINFYDFIKKTNLDLFRCLGIFYNNKWYPGYFLNRSKEYKKKLFSLLILLKNSKI